MKIESVKFVDGGYHGITITGKEYFQTEKGVAIVDDVTRTRKIGLGKGTIFTTSKLRYYFLVLTKHWLESYNKFYDRDTHTVHPLPPQPSPVHLYLKEILGATTITGLKLTDRGCLISGTIDTTNNKKVSITTPFITADDDAGFYYELEDHMKTIIIEVIKEVKQGQIPKYTKDDVIRITANIKKEGADDLTEDQMREKFMDDIQRRGGIIMFSDTDNPFDFDYVGNIGSSEKQLIISTDPEKNLHVNTNTNNIDSHNLKEVSEPDSGSDIKDESDDSIDEKDIALAVAITDDENEPEQLPAKQKVKKKPGSTLASEKSFADATGDQNINTEASDLGNAEFSSDGPVSAENDWGFESAGGENASEEGEVNLSAGDF